MNIASTTDRKIFGKLGSVGLHDIIQLLGMTKRTATVRLRSGTSYGQLYFRDGQIIHASGGGFEGEDSIIELLSWTDPEFTIEDGIDSLPKISITKRTDALLLGTLTRLDETRRSDDVHHRVPPQRVAPRLNRQRRPPARRGASFEVRAAHMLSGIALLPCLPVVWFLLAPRTDIVLEWTALWRNLPRVDGLAIPVGAPVMEIPDAWEVASAVPVEEVRTTPTPPVRPTVAPPGYLTVVVEPWARIEIDGYAIRPSSAR